MKKFVAFVGTLVLLYLGTLTDGVTGDIFPETRIAEGEDSAFDEFPYVVSIQYQTEEKGYIHRCAGAMINSSYVVTVAHCFQSVDTSKYRVVNDNDTHTENETKISNVSTIVIHPDYDSANFWNNDIAILQLLNGFEDYNQVLLPENYSDPDPELKGTTLGWGSGEMNGQPVQMLQRLDDLNIFDSTACEDLYIFGPNENSICAGNEDGSTNIGVCSGDSGNPLIINGTLYGLLSWLRIPCFQLPGVYTKVSNYVEWIHGN
ncbi:serine protease 1-like [Periplaneta americana]|uniref:serine protease 1-like n=1 Tax=Periplaneta americana TaxID=6978 RepID=UPI0037E98F8C